MMNFVFGTLSRGYVCHNTRVPRNNRDQLAQQETILLDIVALHFSSHLSCCAAERILDL